MSSVTAVVGTFEKGKVILSKKEHLPRKRCRVIVNFLDEELTETDVLMFAEEARKDFKAGKTKNIELLYKKCNHSGLLLNA